MHNQAILIPVIEQHAVAHAQEQQEIDSMATLPTKSDVHRFLELLPRSLHLSQLQKQEEQTSSDVPLDTLVEEQTEEDEDQGLVVAWQYRSDVQQERLGLANATTKGRNRPDTTTFCHSYDLSTSLTTQLDVKSNTTLLPLSIGPVGIQSALRFAQTLLRKMKEMHEQNPSRVIRVLIMDWHVEQLARALPIMLSHIRRADLPVVLMIKNESGQSLKWKRLAQRSSDVAIEVESFVSRSLYPPPPEFRDFMGVLKVYKASTATLATSVGHFADLTSQRRPAANVYGIKRDTRKLHLSLLHIPPEDYAAEGGSVGKGAERSGAGKPTTISMGCATSGGKMTVPDF